MRSSSTFSAIALLLLVDLVVFSTVIDPLLRRLMMRYYEVAAILSAMDRYMYMMR